MQADAAMLRSALAAIIENACKYSHEGGRVSVHSSTAAGDQGCIIVRDTGIGIAPADLPLVRERFYRGSNSTAVPGAGTGLFLATTLIEAHGGSLLIESAPGQGTTVTVLLPLAPAATGHLPEAA